ncbi:MAG: hypothetical protein JW748_04060 [Anaerolineales bacterium]|nr:hypothetical protein [Anaerolineales bacterium]
MIRLSVFFRRNFFLLAALAIGCAAALAYFFVILGQTGGRFIYNLDDAYIHLAIAKHIVRDGVYGVTPFEFSSSSSSILWPLLLAGALRLFGDRETLPLLINLAITGVLIAVLYREWDGGGKTPRWAFGMLIGWMVFLPFGPILFNGMETMLQALAAVAFSAAAVRALSGEGKDRLLSLCLLAALCAAVRYEGCFIAAAVCLMLILRGRWKAAVAVGLAAALPVVLYGAYSMSQGWSFLPNSLLIKHSGVAWTDPASLWNMVARPFQPITDIDLVHLPVWQSLAVLLLVMLLMRAHSERPVSFWDARVLPAVLFLLVAAMHSMWITVEMFFRYQAYLNALGIWAIGCLGAPAVEWKIFRRNAAAAAAGFSAAVLVALPLGLLAFQALWKTPAASRNIWQQQYQMGLFLDAYYPQAVVAANDIGAIDYLADLHLVDLFGLASREVLRAKLDGEWQRDLAGALERLTSAEGARIAVLYDNWFGYTPAGGKAAIPPGWVRVADWTIPGNVVCGGATVTWYALRPEEAERLRTALEAFSEKLPADVAVRYYQSP